MYTYQRIKQFIQSIFPKACVLLFLGQHPLYAQLYFPPNTAAVWDTIPYQNLQWCSDKIDSLYALLDSNDTKAFILLKDGKIVLEKYFGGHSSSSSWYWASAGKTLTAFAVGLAQQEGFLSIQDTSSSYLGQGWTVCPAAKENKINIWNQLTMTTGLNDQVPDPNCTLDSCLEYTADATSRWAYHNGPYTLLDQVISSASGQSLNAFLSQRLFSVTGMSGTFLPLGYNNVFWSNARSMARFGLLTLNRGNWDGNNIMTDTTYFQQMINSSQNLNPAYGFLWWLNGKSQYMLPGFQFTFNGSICPDAPADMIAALGKNGQFINVIPSLNMVWIRMGNAPSNVLVPQLLNNEIWKYINDLNCTMSPLTAIENTDDIQLFPNPVEDKLRVRLPLQQKQSAYNYQIINSHGQSIQKGSFTSTMNLLDVQAFPVGLYSLLIQSSTENYCKFFIKN